MKNKKGFTLIELLAVIVILAIIALIAVPIILNMIENARKGAAIDSTYGYIEAVENYQAYEMLKGNDGLKEGVYEITEDKTVDNVKYPKLKGLIKLKGNAPTFGNVGITKNGTVGTANLCVNNYLVAYQNKKAEILPGGCENLGITLTFNISSEKWETSKILEILYPEGKYEYYYKLESGKAKVGEKELVIGEEIKAEANSVNIELLENSKITAWMVKNGEKISLRTYEETKIDNVEIGIPKAEIITKYPIITEYGIESSTNLIITYEKQDGISAQYSVDGGKWIKYNGITPVLGEKVQVKLVKDDSGKSGEVVDAVLSDSVPTDILGNYAYDQNDSTYDDIPKGTEKFIAVNTKKEFKIKIYHHSTSLIINMYNSDNQKLFSETYSGHVWETITVPIGTTKIGLYGGSNPYIHEIKPLMSLPEFTITEKTSSALTINEDGITSGIAKINIKYSSKATSKLYSIDNGTNWLPYTGPITINKPMTILAKQSASNIESEVATFKAIVEPTKEENVLGVNAYDQDDSTYDDIPKGTEEFININSEKEIKFKMHHNSGSLIINMYNSDNQKLFSKTYSGYVWDTITVPSGITKIGLYGGSNPYIYEIVPIMTSPEFTITEKTSSALTINEDGITSGIAKINIKYSSKATSKLYSIDNGTNWLPYTGPITINKPMTILAKQSASNIESEVATFKAIVEPTVEENILGTNAYDGNDSTYEDIKKGTEKFINVNSEKEFQFKINHNSTSLIIKMYDSNNDLKSTNNYQNNGWNTVTVPIGISKIGLYGGSNPYVYEIVPVS